MADIVVKKQIFIGNIVALARRDGTNSQELIKTQCFHTQ